MKNISIKDGYKNLKKDPVFKSVNDKNVTLKLKSKSFNNEISDNTLINTLLFKETFNDLLIQNKAIKLNIDLLFNFIYNLDKTKNIKIDSIFSEVSSKNVTTKLLFTEYVLDERHPLFKVILHFFEKGILEL